MPSVMSSSKTFLPVTSGTKTVLSLNEVNVINRTNKQKKKNIWLNGVCHYLLHVCSLPSSSLRITPFSYQSSLCTCSMINSSGIQEKQRNVNGNFLAMLLLLSSRLEALSLKFLLLLCTSFLMGGFAVHCKVESCCRSMGKNRGREKTCHKMNYISPSLPSSYLMLQSREDRV